MWVWSVAFARHRVLLGSSHHCQPTRWCCLGCPLRLYDIGKRLVVCLCCVPCLLSRCAFTIHDGVGCVAPLVHPRKSPGDEVKATKLRSHLAMVALGESISVRQLERGGIPDATIEDALTKLQQYQVVIPSELKQKLWSVKVRNALQNLGEGAETIGAASDAIKLCIPWEASGDEDIVYKTLALGDLDMSLAERCQLCWDTLAVEVLLPLVSQGEARASAVKRLVTVSLGAFDISDIPDDPSAEAIACELMTLWRCCQTLSSPEHIDPSSIADVDEVTHSRGRAGLALFRDALRNDPYWSGLCTSFDSAKEYMRLYNEDIKRTLRDLTGAQKPFTTESVDYFGEKCDQLRKWQAGLRAGACTQVSEAIKLAISSWTAALPINDTHAEVLASAEKMLKVDRCARLSCLSKDGGGGGRCLQR